MKTELNRKSPVHLPAREIFDAPVIVFLTVCTKGRKPIFADNETHVLLLEAWRAAGAWPVGRYVIMPDHLHLFCAPAEHDSLPITSWITFWKSYATRRWPIPKTLRSGNVISGIDNCAGAKVTIRNGSMLSRIQFEPDWSRNQRIGHTKVR
jgi:REP element-mobilizing transposase RayT